MSELGSYYEVTPRMYQSPAAATPGWEQAPVPGWGTNPMRAGPPRVGVGCAACRGMGQTEGEACCSATKIALMVAGGVALGWLLFGYQGVGLIYMMRYPEGE